MPPSPAYRSTTPTHSTDVIEDARPVPSLVATVVLGLLKGYKILISPLFTGSCRFDPSCSDYMVLAIRQHGAGRGIWLGLRRLSRCRPFGGHGYDPVPRT